MTKNKQKRAIQISRYNWLYFSTLVLTLVSPFVLGRVASADTGATGSSDTTDMPQTERSSATKTVVIKGYSAPTSQTSDSAATTTDDTEKQDTKIEDTNKSVTGDTTTPQKDKTINETPSSASGQPSQTQASEKAPTETNGVTTQTTTSETAKNSQSAGSNNQVQPTETEAKATSAAKQVSISKLSNRAAIQAKLAAAPDDDAQVVNFTDRNLANQVRTSLKLAADADITVGDIRNYTGQTVAIGTESAPIVVTSLTGMEAFQNLPVTKKLNLYVYLANPQGQADLRASGFDLTPLENLRFSELGLYTAFFAKVDVTPLTKLNVDNLRYFNLQPDSNIVANYHAAQNANYGLTNSQLKQLAPTMIAMSNNQVTSWKMIQLADNALTDFSVLNGMNLTTDMRIFAVGQAAINYQPINIVAGQPLTYTADEQIGINGEVLHTAYDQSNVITPVYTYDENGNITSVTWNSAQYLGDNQFYIAAPAKNAATFYHGQWGYLGHTADTDYYINKYYGAISNSVQLMTDAMIFRPTNWQTAPSITINYLDQQTNQIIQAQTVLGTDKTVGDKADLTSLTSIDGYQYVGASVENLQLIYTADPQTVNLYFTPAKAEGTVQINYVDDTTGQVLTVQTVTGTQGTHSDYATAPTVQTYLEQGYSLVSDDYPSDGAIFEATTGTFTVHLKHTGTSVSDQKMVTQTIHYVYADGTQAAPDQETTIVFNRSGVKDQVTGTIDWHNWTATTTQFGAKNSPVIANYVATPAVVAAVDGITPTSDNIVTTVTYLKAGSPSTSTDDVINPGINTQQPNGEKEIEQSIPARKIAGQPAQLAVTMTRPTQTAAQKSGKSQERQNQLPQTNEKSTNWLVLAGIGLMTLLSAVGIERKH